MHLNKFQLTSAKPSRKRVNNASRNLCASTEKVAAGGIEATHVWVAPVSKDTKPHSIILVGRYIEGRPIWLRKRFLQMICPYS